MDDHRRTSATTDSTFTIRTDVYESVEFDDHNRQVAVLRAGASIVDKPSGRETIPIQLFLSQDQNDTFRGKRLRLAGYTDDPDAAAARRQGAIRCRAGGPEGRAPSPAAGWTSRPI